MVSEKVEITLDEQTKDNSKSLMEIDLGLEVCVKSN